MSPGLGVTPARLAGAVLTWEIMGNGYVSRRDKNVEIIPADISS